MSIIAQTIDPASLRNYDWLKARVAEWLHRSDLSDKIPDFIALAEARINRLARVRTMENEVPLTMTVGSRFVALPGGFNVPRGVWLDRSQPPLTPALPESLPASVTTGQPQFWAIDGANLALDRPADQPYPLTLRYSGGFILSDGIKNNTLLTNYPDLYLYGSLMESAPYIRDTELITMWQGFFDRAVKEINANESRIRAAAPLRTELAQVLCNSTSYDIRRGY